MKLRSGITGAIPRSTWASAKGRVTRAGIWSSRVEDWVSGHYEGRKVQNNPCKDCRHEMVETRPYFKTSFEHQESLRVFVIPGSL